MQLLIEFQSQVNKQQENNNNNICNINNTYKYPKESKRKLKMDTIKINPS